MKKLIKSCIYSCLIGYFIFGITLLIGILFAIQQNTFTLNSVFIYAEILGIIYAGSSIFLPLRKLAYLAKVFSCPKFFVY